MAERKAAREAELIGERAAAAALAESLVTLKVLVFATAHARLRSRLTQRKNAVSGVMHRLLHRVRIVQWCSLPCPLARTDHLYGDGVQMMCESARDENSSATIHQATGCRCVSTLPHARFTHGRRHLMRRKRRRGGQGGHWTRTVRTWHFWTTRSHDARQRGSKPSRSKSRYRDAAYLPCAMLRCCGVHGLVSRSLS